MESPAVGATSVLDALVGTAQVVLALVIRVTGGDAWIEALRGSRLDLDLDLEAGGGGGEMG